MFYDPGADGSCRECGMGAQHHSFAMKTCPPAWNVGIISNSLKPGTLPISFPVSEGMLASFPDWSGVTPSQAAEPAETIELCTANPSCGLPDEECGCRAKNCPGQACWRCGRVA